MILKQMYVHNYGNSCSKECQQKSVHERHEMNHAFINLNGTSNMNVASNFPLFLSEWGKTYNRKWKSWGKAKALISHRDLLHLHLYEKDLNTYLESCQV